MASGDDLFTDREREDISRAVAQADAVGGATFSVYAGDLGTDSSTRAQTIHGALGPGAPDAVLVAVDPASRRVEVVTGEHAHRYLDDRACALAIVSMTTQFAGGDLAGGIVNGLRTLAEHARHPQVLHLDLE